MEMVDDDEEIRNKLIKTEIESASAHNYNINNYYYSSPASATGAGGEATVGGTDITMVMGGRRQQQGVVGHHPPGTTLNTITPCAACKLLRRRCAEECPFSPYFSPHEPHKFSAVHKVFGASNVSKMLMEVPESQRADAANSLVYEANVRLRDPVYGCMGAISALQQQIQFLQAELNAVRAELLRHKYREVANTIIGSAPAPANSIAGAGAVSVVAVENMPQAPPTPPPPPPPPSSVVVVSSSSSTSSATSPPSTSAAQPPMYAVASTAVASFGTIHNNNMPFFD